MNFNKVEICGVDTSKLPVISEKEKQRASYYNYYTGKRWGHAESYDLCVDTSLLGMERTRQLLRQYIEWRMDK